MLPDRMSPDELRDRGELAREVAIDEVVNRPAEDHLRRAADIYRTAYVPGADSRAAGAFAGFDKDHTAIQTELLWAIAKKLTRPDED